MKATGIVRRIDDLGRVVIPKEIRRTMRIREGEPLEIYTDREGTIIFKKYSPVGEMTETASLLAETVSRVCACPVLISDRDAVIACAGLPRREVLEQKVSAGIEQLMEERNVYVRDSQQPSVPVLAQSDKFEAGVVAPVIAGGDVIGAAILPLHEQQIPDETDVKMSQTIAQLLARQSEG